MSTDNSVCARVVSADPRDELAVSSEYWPWSAGDEGYEDTAVAEADGRPVYVIAGSAQ